MHRQWHIRQQLELLSSPTSVQYHRIETYSSVVEGVRRIRRILAHDYHPENDRLIRACCRNDLDAVRWLLDQTDLQSIDLKRGINRSALHEAVLHRNSQPLVRLLCQSGADPKQRDSLGRTPIHYAASCGHSDVIKELLSFARIPISSLLDMEGRCPLMYACGEGHLTLCQWLIEYADADYSRSDDRGRTCLIYACRSGHTQLVQWLLPLLPSQSTTIGWYPLHFACSAGHLDIVRLLISDDRYEGQLTTHSGHSALFMAMHAPKNNREMVKYLLDSHSSVQLTSQDITDLSCEKSLVLLLVQRRHSLTYLVDLLEYLNGCQLFLHLLLLSEHSFSWEKLTQFSQHRSLIDYYHQNSLTLKQIARRSIRKLVETSANIDCLMIPSHLKSFLRFEVLN